MSLTWNSYPNVPYMGVLPGGIAHFGGDTQIFTIDPDEYGATYPIVQLNPIATALLNQQAIGQVPQYTLPSQQQMQQISDKAAQIAAGIVSDINTNMLKQSLNVSTQNLAAQKTRLNALLANPDLPEADKTEVNRLLNKIQEEERKINELSQKMAEMDSGEALKEAQQIETEIREIITDANKIKTPEKKQETPQADESQGADQNTPSTPANPSTPSNPANPVNPSTPANPTNPATPASRKDEESQAVAERGKITEEHRQIADLFHDAIAGLGTDDATFNALFDEGVINKDNIVEVMAAYEETYGASFMDDFMDDADSGFFCAGGQKVKYGKAIARMLRARAVEAGVLAECKDDLHAITKEMDSTFYVSNDVYENYDNIAATIAAKENLA